MPSYAHLPLRRLERQVPRRSRAPFPAPPPARDPGRHADQLRRQIDNAIATPEARGEFPGRPPFLILKAKLTRSLDEATLQRNDFQILSYEQDQALILLASDAELPHFRERLAAYEAGAVGQTAPRYNSLFAVIDEMSGRTAAERIGPLLQADGVRSPEDIDGRASYIVDLELFFIGSQIEMVGVMDQLRQEIETGGGQEITRFISPNTIALIRVRVRGTVLRQLLSRAIVLTADLIPEPDLGETTAFNLTIRDLPAPVPPAPNAPLLGILDTGLSEHPLLDGCIAHRFGWPENLGDADARGHGTRVAGIAAYGDLRDCVSSASFTSPVRLISGKVINDDGRFPDEHAVPELMEKAIGSMAQRGCRIINISLGDRRKIPYAGGHASAWAQILDDLARRHDAVITVSAGNPRKIPDAPWGDADDHLLTRYPDCLADPANRLIDPAMAAIAVTVGNLAQGTGIAPRDSDTLQWRSLTERGYPSPITRCGPGLNGAIKPEFVDYGGTGYYDGYGHRLVTGDSHEHAGMLTLNATYLENLFTSSTGTSMAAPRIAYKAALILRSFPNASANFIRALLASCATIPAEAVSSSPNLDEDQRRTLYGYGVPNVELALASDDNRVILFADNQLLDGDAVALYEIPIPAEFQSRGRRHIRVTLAFDPPVKRTRLDYLGLRMRFELIRGQQADAVFEALRRRANDEEIDSLPGNCRCTLQPGIRRRETSTLQSADFSMTADSAGHGDTYYLAVICERRWAGEEIMNQRFAVTVHLQREDDVRFYATLRQRLRL